MRQTAILQCPQCKGLLLAATNQKTRTCPYCGNRVDLNKAIRLATAENALEASQVLRKIKTQRKNNTGKI